MTDRRYGERYILDGRTTHLAAMVIQADERRITRFSVENVR